MMPGPARDFPATLSRRARLVTGLVGFGVGLGVPAILGLAFAATRGEPLFALAPLPFALGLLLAWRYRVIGYRVAPEAVSILRPAGASPVAMSALSEARFPASRPDGATFGLARVEGLFGSQGLYWNRSWGRFRAYVTDERNTVELRLADGGRILVSPDDPAGFVAAVSAALGR